jgi:hypothetical protein
MTDALSRLTAALSDRYTADRKPIVGRTRNVLRPRQIMTSRCHMLML